MRFVLVVAEGGGFGAAVDVDVDREVGRNVDGGGDEVVSSDGRGATVRRKETLNQDLSEFRFKKSMECQKNKGIITGNTRLLKRL